MPLMSNAHTYISDAILVAVLSFVISVSMAKMFAAKHKYTIDADQVTKIHVIIHCATCVSLAYDDTNKIYNDLLYMM